MKRSYNPFPAPCIKQVGSCNLWDIDDVLAWEEREKQRTLLLETSQLPCI